MIMRIYYNNKHDGDYAKTGIPIFCVSIWRQIPTTIIILYDVTHVSTVHISGEKSITDIASQRKKNVKSMLVNVCPTS